MNEIPEDLRDLIDDYLDGAIDECRLQELETRLQADDQARRYFVRYCRLHTDLDLEARAQQAGERAMKSVNEPNRTAVPFARFGGRAFPRWALGLTAAGIVMGIGLWAFLKFAQAPVEVNRPHEEIAWLINAQNCQWAENLGPAGDMQAGKVLRLERGLVEIRLQKGVRLIMEGPAEVEITSANSVRMRRGKLTAKVPDAAKGFQVVTPKGKVVDLGTEFALAVEEDGSTDVHVYVGQVEAHAGADPSGKMINVQEKQSARIDIGGVTLKPVQPESETRPFVRDIPLIVPRVFNLDFREPIANTLLDANGRGIGLSYRLPGTGKRLKANDANLVLNQTAGQLELTTTNSDLNTQFKLDQGEYIGMKLTDLGFTGGEDFAVTVVVPNIPALQRVGQFGMYAGPRSDRTIRGGLLSRKEPEQYRQFLVQNQGGKDAPPHYVGLTTPGDDLRLTLRRLGKLYSLTVENLTTSNSTTLTMPQPASMEGEGNLHVGFFGANTQSEARRTLVLKEFKATVWTLVPGPR